VGAVLLLPLEVNVKGGYHGLRCYIGQMQHGMAKCSFVPLVILGVVPMEHSPLIFSSQITKRIGDYKICMDQGFPRAGDAAGILVGPIPERSACCLHCSVRDHLIRLSNIYTSLRQASEWGMRELQGTFPCCKKCLPTDKDKRQGVLECIILVHNFRTEVVGLTQLQQYLTPNMKM
jgi:hypothetical protein